MIGLDQQAETTMVDLEVPVEGVSLDALDAFLSADQSPPDSMMLSDLDGFLTAIAIGPELVMPSEWLPVIWGDDEPVVTDEAEMQAVLGGILSRYNQIRREIANGTFEPILWSDADGMAIATDWAEGFMQGRRLPARSGRRNFVPRSDTTFVARRCDRAADSFCGPTYVGAVSSLGPSRLSKSGNAALNLVRDRR
jgi:hypothetical protein